ncbi:MAG: hypothetical protein QGH60_05560 [Phycisphaerae bacterium]|jgi:hypothetical protein|nr:hypothetical protein [Phycisphaerae bacterium]
MHRIWKAGVFVAILSLGCLVGTAVAAKKTQPKQKPKRRQKVRRQRKQQGPKVAKPTVAQQAYKAIVLARKTLEYVQKAEPRPKMGAELDALVKRHAAADEIGKLRRRIIMSHPALNFERLLINQNPPPAYSHNCDQYLGRHSNTGPGITILESWKDNPKPTVLLKGKLPVGATNKPKLSWDAKRMVFAFCDHTQSNKARRRYFIYEATVDGSRVTQITGTASDAMARWDSRQTVLIEDNDPCYLPDGGVAFVSTRMQGFGRCHNGRYTPSLLLHRVQRDGSDLKQISFAEANEADPVVLPDGRMVYTRWDYINRNVTMFHMLWYTRPDGTTQANFFGADTVSPWMISETAPIPNSTKVVALATGHHSFSTGCIIRIDPVVGENGSKPIKRITPEIPFFEAEARNIRGCYSTPWPITENLFLASYSPQTLPAQGRRPADTFAIYLVDSFGGRELIYKGATSCFSPTPLRPRKAPRLIPSSLQPGGRKTGVFAVQDVYETMNDPNKLIKPGVIKALRINEIVNQPAVWKNQPSLVRHEVAKNILGTVPVKANGSVMFTAPAGKPLQLQALDENGLAVMTMRTLVYLQPGEFRSCVGCHEQKGNAPPVSPMAMKGKPVAIVPPTDPSYANGFSFMRSVQPVLDRHCIRCHGLDKIDGKLDLLGTVEKPKLPKGWMKSAILKVTRSYNSICNAPGLIKIAKFKAETHTTRPRDYFAAASKLAPLLLKGHAKVKFTAREIAPIIDWLDVNSQYCGNYSFNRIEDRQADATGEKALRAWVARRFDAKLATQPFAALVNVGRPEASRILNAPLPIAAGGWGQISGGFKSKDEPDYKQAVKLVTASIQPRKYRDINGTCGREKCICKSCWVRKLASASRK